VLDVPHSLFFWPIFFVAYLSFTVVCDDFIIQAANASIKWVLLRSHGFFFVCVLLTGSLIVRTDSVIRTQSMLAYQAILVGTQVQGLAR